MVRGNKDQLTPLKIYHSHFTTEFWVFNLISKRSQNEHHFFTPENILTIRLRPLGSYYIFVS